MHLVVKTQVIAAVKEISNKKGCRVNNIDSSFIPALNNRVLRLVEDSVERASLNQRRTLMGKDS